jgi:hypothetical protein
VRSWVQSARLWNQNDTVGIPPLLRISKHAILSSLVEHSEPTSPPGRWRSLPLQVTVESREQQRHLAHWKLPWEWWVQCHHRMLVLKGI